MKFYFQLQFKRVQRTFNDFGVHPVLGISVAVLVFVLLAWYMFHEISYAHGLFLVLGLTWLSNLSERRRNDQLKLMFKSSKYIRVRLIENGLLMIPFVLVLTYFGYWIWSAALVLIGSLLAIMNPFRFIGLVVKTPFKRMPFENIVGFRRSYALLLIVYLLVYKSIQVENYNLGLFSLGFIFLIALSFYVRPEKKYFVWIFSRSPRQFLVQKIILGVVGSSILSSIPFGILIWFYPDHLWMTLMIQMGGYIFISTVILAKYSSYPHEIGLGQAVLLGVSLWFPPMLLGVIPYLYVKSKEQLELVLNDKNNTAI